MGNRVGQNLSACVSAQFYFASAIINFYSPVPSYYLDNLSSLCRGVLRRQAARSVRGCGPGQKSGNLGNFFLARQCIKGDWGLCVWTMHPSDALLSLFHERLQCLETKAGQAVGAGKGLLRIESYRDAAHWHGGAPWRFTSYNVLSLDSGLDGYYQNLNGTPKCIDAGDRMLAINDKVGCWMAQGQIVCLQEVTWQYLSKESNPELHVALREHAYSVYHHHYGWIVRRELPAKGLQPLGLAILVPTRLYQVHLAGVLTPWKDPVLSAPEQAALDSATKQYGAAKTVLGLLTGPGGGTPGILQRCVKLVGEGGAEELGMRLRLLMDGLAAKMAAAVPAVNVVDGPFKDRSIIGLVLQDAGGRRMAVANVHLPCQYHNPLMMVSIAFKAKQALLDWMAASEIAGLHLLLCGDFNSEPMGEAYGCFDGKLAKSSQWVDTRISAVDFRRCVTSEPWNDTLRDTTDGCTCFGFTQPRLKVVLAEFRQALVERFSVSDEVAGAYADTAVACKTLDECEGHWRGETKPRLDLLVAALEAKRDFFKPRPLWLDHFFLRSGDVPLRVEHCGIQTKSQVIHRLRNMPIPDLVLGEPSDHLPIHLTLIFD
jgi:hypothetical protein